MNDDSSQYQFQTVQEAAKVLRVSPSAVYDLCRIRSLPHLRVGTGRGVIRIAQADLETYLQNAYSTSSSVAKVKPAQVEKSKLPIRPFQHIKIESPAPQHSEDNRGVG